MKKRTGKSGLKRLLLAAFLSLTFFAYGASTAMAASFSYDGPGAPYVDTDPATVVTLSVADYGTITDLNVYLELAPDYEICGVCDALSNLDITLVHDGMSVILYPGSDSDDGEYMTAHFDDDAVDYAPTYEDVIGTFLPYEPLSVFNGADLFGDWDLVIFDHHYPLDYSPTLVTWRIYGTTAAVPEPSTLLLLGSGLVGLGFVRRRFKG